jgi:hypothetical protein
MLRGQYRLLRPCQQQLLECKLEKHFSVSGDKSRRMLLGVNRRLAREVNFRDISISPDGKQVLWHVPVQKTTANWSWAHAAKHLFHSEAGAKETKIMSGIFDTSGALWLRQSDVE